MPATVIATIINADHILLNAILKSIEYLLLSI